MGRRRIWSETVPSDVLVSARALGLLKRYGLELSLAVRPRDLEGLPRTLACLADAEIPARLWPMLEDEDGRWANAQNHDRFADFARRVMDAGRGSGADELVIDLEPAIEDVRMALSSVRAAGKLLTQVVDGTRLAAAKAAFTSLVDEMAARQVKVTAVAVPMVLLDDAEAARWQALLGTPVDGPAWAHVNVMLYTSILEGWSRGLFDRRGAVSVLSSACLATRERFEEKGSVSIGAVGVGAFGDEPVYRSPEELARDVAVARAAGMNDLSLFDLGGVLARRPSEAWLDAFVETPADPKLPPETRRGRAFVSLAAWTGASLGWIAPLLRRPE